MAFEGLIYYDAAGATAATQITNFRDANYNFDIEKGETTVTGDGSAIPITTERVTQRTVAIDFTMLNKSTDATLAALLTAATAGTPVALRLKDHASGKGFDGDVILSWQNGRPFKGEQTYQFTAAPTEEAGRTPQLFV